MKLYYHDDFATIYHGDCREILPQIDLVDAIICSPPYNTLNPTVNPSGLHAERKTGVNKWLVKNGGYYDQRPESDYQKWQNELLHLFLDHAPIVWINHKIRFRDGRGIHPLSFYDAPLFSEIIWDRGVSMALNCGRFAPSHEYFFGFGKPARWNNLNNSRMSVWRIAPGTGKDASNDHPCPYPTKLIEPIIQSCVFDRGVIDPFMGSGTTLVAAKNLRRKAIGIEIEEKYCEIAARRLRQEVLPLQEKIKC